MVIAQCWNCYVSELYLNFADNYYVCVYVCSLQECEERAVQHATLSVDTIHPARGLCCRSDLCRPPGQVKSDAAPPHLHPVSTCRVILTLWRRQYCHSTFPAALSFTFWLDLWEVTTFLNGSGIWLNAENWAALISWEKYRVQNNALTLQLTPKNTWLFLKTSHINSCMQQILFLCHFLVIETLPQLSQTCAHKMGWVLYRFEACGGNSSHMGVSQ